MSVLRSFLLLRPQLSVCASCRFQLRTEVASAVRSFSSSTTVLVVDRNDRNRRIGRNANSPSMGSILDKGMLNTVHGSFKQPGNYQEIIPEFSDMNVRNLTKNQEWDEEEERHHLHIYAHKHNTHITLTKPNRDALISVSCGNIGFKKAGRGTYDAAYQLAAFVMTRIQDKGLLPEIEKLEVIYRGFGPGREATTKAILGKEGKRIRPLICRLTDSTRLKFGGTRSPAMRRLG
ncbi:translational machinery component [Lojkania enalia]|uniref:Small ribosomal subunit protein uS11m n=1 Tax=Lojkania enalia TaxID=147567 RepID=A0A9P4KCW5_9PLEO|nr:translational machinery component [Didymosphaeria enalia]